MPVIRAWPISRRNSTVLGSDARCEAWRRWWYNEANWKGAFPTKPSSACLNVPCQRLVIQAVVCWEGTEVFRVRPKNDRGRPVLIAGKWHWQYPGTK